MAIANPDAGLSMAQPITRTKVTPIDVERSTRRHTLTTLTSIPAGKMAPLAVIPLLREDKLNLSRFRITFEMLETAEILLNAVNVRVMAYLVPNLAYERFKGFDDLNRSYMKEPETPGNPATIIPFISPMTAPAHGANAILKTMGKHARPGQTLNLAYVEAYNTIWNFRARNRSPDIALRAIADPSLAKAFWNHSQFNHIVPDFDQAVIDGEVPLNVTAGSLRVKGIGLPTPGGATAPAVTNATVRETPHDGVYDVVYPSAYHIAGGTATPPAGQSRLTMRVGNQGGAIVPQIFAEMEENGITVSLSNIELARKTQAFAMMRREYGGHTDDYLIDMLMNGLTVPDQAWKQPILLFDNSTIFGMSKRYASDSLDLTASVVNGATFMDLAITTPTVPTGGVVMILCEVTPEQIFERQQDPYLHIVDQEFYPEFLRDTLDPEKVEVVENQYIDIDHDTPTATFGYAPLNHKWNHQAPQIGGRFFRPLVNAPTDEDRMRIWAVETENPTLSEDFYLCTNMHTKPFVVTNQDPFDVTMKGIGMITGNTVFGQYLVEATDDYAEIAAEAPMDRIEKP